MTFLRPAKKEDCAIRRGSKGKNVVMEVISEEGMVVGELVNGGEDDKPPKQVFGGGMSLS